MLDEPKHRFISKELMSEITAGRYGPSGRLPSETQLCKRFSVSRPTAARALRDLQDKGLIERRAGSGTYVRSEPGSAAGTGGRQLGLLIPNLGSTEIFELVCGELAALARGQEYMLLWGGIARPPAGQETSVPEVEQWCEQFITRQVRGVFFAPFEHISQEAEVNRRLAEGLRRAGIAVVLLDRDGVPFPARSEFDLVGIDNFAAGYLVADHLLKLGARRPIYVGRPHSAPTITARAVAARTAIQDRGLPLPADFLRQGDPDDPRFIQLLAE